ncbi:hypothetical protein BKA57DRAFT_58684 [Linnemannia elongata]|nr:hypothetical protein BKA57DRAFT_58684 [Linnemannia elongata]
MNWLTVAVDHSHSMYCTVVLSVLFQFNVLLFYTQPTVSFSFCSLNFFLSYSSFPHPFIHPSLILLLFLPSIIFRPTSSPLIHSTRAPALPLSQQSGYTGRHRPV